MILISSGRGYTPVLLFFAILIFGNIVTAGLMGGYIIPISFLLTGLFCFIYGDKWNNKDINYTVDERSGKRINAINPHTLFWIPMQYWSYIFAGLGLIYLYNKSITAAIFTLLTIIGLLGYLKIRNGLKKEEAEIEKPKVKY